jgi:hypothetical protein
MRQLVAVLAMSSVVLAGCGAKEEAPSADSAAVSGPAALTAAAMAGTWDGTSYAVPGDTVSAKWTVVGAADGSGKLLVAGQTDSIAYTSMFDADSMVTTSVPYTDPTLPAGAPQVTFRGVGRLTSDGKLAGTTWLRLASNPDSVVGSVRWEATRRP